MRFPRLRGIPGSSSWSSREIFGLAVPSVLIARHRKTGVRLQISHINPKYGRPDHAMRNTLQMIEWAREEGIDVAMDMMPTNWNFTSAMAQLPAWSYSLSKDEFLELLKSDEGREPPSHVAASGGRKMG